MTKSIKEKRSTSPVVQDRDAQLAAEANEWARGQTRQWFEDRKTGFYTPADILAALDERQDAPPAWWRWMSEYPTRYQMVRNACVALHRKEFLESRQELNANNREATSYQRARDLDDWRVAVEGGEQDSVTELVAGWLRSNPKALKGVRTIAITRRTGSRSEHPPDRSGSSRAQAVQRGRG